MTPAEKDAAVRKAITNWPRLTPSDIRQLTAISTDSVRRALARIGAVRHPGGRYSAPPDAPGLGLVAEWRARRASV